MFSTHENEVKKNSYSNKIILLTFNYFNELYFNKYIYMYALLVGRYCKLVVKYNFLIFYFSKLTNNNVSVFEK